MADTKICFHNVFVSPLKSGLNGYMFRDLVDLKDYYHPNMELMNSYFEF